MLFASTAGELIAVALLVIMVVGVVDNLVVVFLQRALRAYPSSGRHACEASPQLRIGAAAFQRLVLAFNYYVHESGLRGGHCYVVEI